MALNPIRKVRKLVQRSWFYRRASEKFLSQRTFEFNGEALHYVIHPYNHTWTNERAVELAIAAKWLEKRKKTRILEVGNVSRHYYSTRHDVVDKYEKAEGIINVDIVDFSPEQKYHSILSISTLEHVGWDRDRKEPEKIRVAVDKLRSLLAPAGEALVSFPIGFNSFLDEFIADRALPFDEYYFLKRINAHNEWEQVNWEQVRDCQYNSPFFHANAIAVAMMHKPAS